MTRIGLVGAGGGVERLRRAFELLMNDADADPIVYLGSDDLFDRAVQRMPGARVASDEMLLRAAAAAAIRGGADEIEGLLAAERQAHALERLRALPPPPALAVEMLADRILVLAHDVSALGEDDLANASVIVHGAARRDHRREGRRHFVSPGRLDSDDPVVAVISSDGPGTAGLVFRRLDGSLAGETALAFGPSSRVVVSRPP